MKRPVILFAVAAGATIAAVAYFFLMKPMLSSIHKTIIDEQVKATRQLLEVSTMIDKELQTNDRCYEARLLLDSVECKKESFYTDLDRIHMAQALFFHAVSFMHSNWTITSLKLPLDTYDRADPKKMGMTVGNIGLKELSMRNYQLSQSLAFFQQMSSAYKPTETERADQSAEMKTVEADLRLTDTTAYRINSIITAKASIKTLQTIVSGSYTQEELAADNGSLPKEWQKIVQQQEAMPTDKATLEKMTEKEYLTLLREALQRNNKMLEYFVAQAKKQRYANPMWHDKTPAWQKGKCCKARR